MVYISRLADQELAHLLEIRGAVNVCGPKWCGKTSTALQAARSVLYLQDPDTLAANLLVGAEQPSLLLEGAKPRLIDEWQVIPQLWDAVRFAIDRASERAQFILTGSSTPTVSPLHSGVGRIARMTMRPMSLVESGESSGAVSLRNLFDERGVTGVRGDMNLSRLAFLVCRGGWPEAVLAQNDVIALELSRAYIDELVDSDVAKMDGVSRDSTRMRALLRSYGRNLSTQASLATIRGDVLAAGVSIAPNTLTDYIDALTRAYVIEDLPAWNPTLRSKTAIRTSPTRHFVDPSLAAGALRVNPEGLLADIETFGFFFESLAIRDLRIYTQTLGGNLFHYRDKSGLEADAVVVLNDGRWGLVEIKLGASQAESAARNLLHLVKRIDTEKIGEPSFLLVLTGTGSAYMRADGVSVVPLGLLGP